MKSKIRIENREREKVAQKQKQKKKDHKNLPICFQILYSFHPKQKKHSLEPIHHFFSLSLNLFDDSFTVSDSLSISLAAIVNAGGISVGAAALAGDSAPEIPRRCCRISLGFADRSVRAPRHRRLHASAAPTRSEQGEGQWSLEVGRSRAR